MRHLSSSNLRLKEVNTYNHLPSQLRLAAGDKTLEGIEPQALYTKLFIKLEHLQNLFLIERILQKAQPNLSLGDLIQRSLEVISATVTFWTRNDILVGMEGDHEWFIMGYAVPAAVALCECLLRDHDHDCLASSRSNIIGQLSLLIGFMEWLTSKNPHAHGCSRAKSIIAKALNLVLNQSPCVPHHAATNSKHQQIQDEAVYLDDLRDIDTFRWLV